MISLIEILININMLIFTFSLVQIVFKLYKEPYLLDQRINILYSFFDKDTIFSKNNKKKVERWNNIGFFIVIAFFSIILISYFIIFYQFVIENYDDRFWYVFRLICTPFIFLILPNFLPKILKNLQNGFFLKNIDDLDRKKIKLNKFDFILNWINLGILIFILTLFLSWEINIIWLSLIIIILIILFTFFWLIISRKSKLF